MEVESTLFDFNRISNNVGRFKGGLWEKYIAHEQANSCDFGENVCGGDARQREPGRIIRRANGQVKEEKFPRNFTSESARRLRLGKCLIFQLEMIPGGIR